ncbi:unnamed protein product [Pylaiella littoralis]
MALKLLPVCCGFLLSSMPAPVDAVTATKAIFDYRTGEDFGTEANCVDAYNKNTRYLQIELFDYNQTPNLELTWRQVTDECGNAISDGFEESMSWSEGDITTDRLQMDMYICAPWGNYELTIISKSTNGGNAMERIAWEVEYGPKEYHIYDTLNTPFFSEEPASDYAPIASGDGTANVYKFPLDGAEGYYSVMYSGPFPPLECPNLHPAGVDYVGCFDAGLFGTADGPSGSSNDADPAEPYRMFDGIDDDGVDAEGVMTLEKCASICGAQGTRYFGLESAIKCLCGDELDGSLYPDVDGEGGSVCGIDYTFDVNIPEYKFLCSGDSRVLCGTDDHISVYSLDGSGSGSGYGFTSLGCAADSQSDRVMEVGPIAETSMSAEICLGICLALDPTYTHFGTEYGDQCFCTGDLGTTSDSSACTMDCVGTEGEICGGNDAITVYEIEPIVVPTPAPETVGGGDDYFSLGCAADSKSARVMEVGPIAESPMSAEICLGICLALDPTYTHFGTEYGDQCFCTGDLGTTSDSSACTMDCAGTEGEICGGNDAITVYEIEPIVVPTPAPETVGGGDGYFSLGCAADSKSARVMEVGPISETSMSAEICLGICLALDPTYTHFGTEFGNECFCTGDLGTTSDTSACTMDCAGTEGEICGGSDAISVYEIDAPVTTPDDYTSLGCYSDPQDGSRAMEVKKTASEMSAEICYNLCIEEDPSYEFFGTQYSVECWCSSIFSEPAADGVCNTGCAGNISEICGGVDAISAYAIN